MPPRNLSLYRLATGLPPQRRSSVMVWKLLIAFIFYQLGFGSKSTRRSWVSHLLLAFSSEGLLEPSLPLLTLLKEFQNTIILNTCYLFEQNIRKSLGGAVTQERPCSIGHTRKEIRLQCSPRLWSETWAFSRPQSFLTGCLETVSQLQITTHPQPSLTCFAILYQVFIVQLWGRFEEKDRKSRNERIVLSDTFMPPPKSKFIEPCHQKQNKLTQAHRFHSF